MKSEVISEFYYDFFKIFLNNTDIKKRKNTLKAIFQKFNLIFDTSISR